MRIIITTLIVVLNFILQTTLFPYLAMPRGIPEYRLDYCNLLFPAARQ